MNALLKHCSYIFWHFGETVLYDQWEFYIIKCEWHCVCDYFRIRFIPNAPTQMVSPIIGMHHEITVSFKAKGVNLISANVIAYLFAIITVHTLSILCPVLSSICIQGHQYLSLKRMVVITIKWNKIVHFCKCIYVE